MSYNLNDNISDGFNFTINGKEFFFRYPLMSDFDPLKPLDKKRKELELALELAQSNEAKEEISAQIDEVAEKQADVMHSFVSPVGHKENIKDILKASNIRVVEAYNKMIEKELNM